MRTGVVAVVAVPMVGGARPSRDAQLEAGNIAARGALGLLVAERVADEPVLRESTGRPAFGDRWRHLSLSLSHSGGVAVAACGVGRVGVDVERVRTVPRARELAGKVFDPAVAAHIAEAPADRRSAQFLLAWTQLEAVCKATGSRLTELFGEPLPDEWPVRPMDLIDGYVGALASADHSVSVMTGVDPRLEVRRRTA